MSVRPYLRHKSSQKRADQFKFQAEISERENLTREQIVGQARFANWLGKNWEGRLAVAPGAPEMAASDEALLERSVAEAQAMAQASRKEAERKSRIAKPIELEPENPGP